MTGAQTLAAFLGILLIILGIREFWKPETTALLGGTAHVPAGTAQTASPPVPGSYSAHDVIK